MNKDHNHSIYMIVYHLMVKRWVVFATLLITVCTYSNGYSQARADSKFYKPTNNDFNHYDKSFIDEPHDKYQTVKLRSLV